jgi:hypothetical protein
MDASIIFIPGMCSDDGRAITGWYNVYTRCFGAGKNEFWNEPKYCPNLDEAKKLCNDKGWNIIEISGI